MPKKGIQLPTQTIEIIKNYLKEHKMTQEKFAKKLGVSSRTLSNWLSGRSPVEPDELDNLAKILGIGLEDLFNGELPEEYDLLYNFYKETVKAVWKVYKSGLAGIGQRIYKKIDRLFRNHVSFVLTPRKGFFQTFEHDTKKGKNYYFQFWIQLEEEIAEAKFVISFTIGNVVRVDYGEIIVKPESVEIKQYYQTPTHYQVKRPVKDVCTTKVVTWFDEMSHTFIVVSDVQFKIVEKGRISEGELKQVQNQANDIALFPKHFFFHEDD
ncbi:MAG: hypothetical protein BWK79_08050 [Beggiatoa sp. IS2]|nr:MAG: hypothetical protein BWK79_08050 [Beggiatoa sp. IS2]